MAAQDTAASGRPFDWFVVFAEMRTGSNFLEANLNAMGGVTCHGEAFNPHFIGYPNSAEILGITQPQREADPLRLVNAIRAQSGGPAAGLGGFRFFHDHDSRAAEIALADPRCAKIVLTRNPLDSYVSWKIAQATGQWKLTDVKRRKEARAAFDPAEFLAHLDALQQFQLRLLRALQTSGQTAFYVSYEDLQDLEVMNGLAAWLGRPPLEALDTTLKPQNPGDIADKVENPQAVEAALAQIDRFDLGRSPNFEPRRGPAVPGFVAAASAPLLYMPVRGGPEQAVAQWLAALDGVAPQDLTSGFSQKTLRQWKRARPGHRSFAVLRHPLARAHAVFCARILADGPGSFGRIRTTLRRVHKLPLPENAPGPDWDIGAHRAAFAAFLEFVKANLAGQTSIRVDPGWATQAQVLQGMADFGLPDRILREEDLAIDLPALAAQAGIADAPPPGPDPADQPFALSQVCTDEIEALAQDVYQRDHLMLGFGPWQDRQG